jgi:flagellar secretion chaperone FliS
MPQGIQNAYLESRITTAEPLELVRLLYQAATGAARDARRDLAAGDIAARSRAISKAYAIMAQLAGSLDRERGGAIAERLAQLYDYIQRKLLEANFTQSDVPLAEVLALLAILGEAWDGVTSQTRPPEGSISAPPMPWGQASDPDAAHAGRAWSL